MVQQGLLVHKSLSLVNDKGSLPDGLRIGLMAVVAAKAYGATNIIVSDLEDNRLEAAKRLGAS
jgi:hypothetical protein